MDSRCNRLTSERGAVLIFVGIAILVLVAFLVFVVDYGVMWMSRGQAQNSADAAALAGAVARAYDDPDDPPLQTGRAAEATRLAGQANPVWSLPPIVQASFDCPTGVTGKCVRADVYRNGQLGSTPLPMVFGPVLNLFNQGIRATATAVVGIGNATECMRPFSVADKWNHVVDPVPEYQRWRKEGSTPVEEDPHDLYVPADENGPGSGFRVPEDVGAPYIIKGGNNPNSSATTIQTGWFFPVRLPDANGGFMSGADDYRTTIRECVGAPVTIGMYLPLENGAMIGPTNQGVGDLIDLDPAATFNESTKEVENSCAPSCAPISPRIVPISVFDIDEFQYRQATGDWSVCPTGGKCVRVVNILGYFVSGMTGQDVNGYLLTLPGEFMSAAPTLDEDAAFVQVIRLVR